MLRMLLRRGMRTAWRHAARGRCAARSWCGEWMVAAGGMCVHAAPRLFIWWRSGMADEWPRRM